MLETIVAAGGLLTPIYVMLWKIHGDLNGCVRRLDHLARRLDLVEAEVCPDGQCAPLSDTDYGSVD